MPDPREPDEAGDELLEQAAALVAEDEFDAALELLRGADRDEWSAYQRGRGLGLEFAALVGLEDEDSSEELLEAALADEDKYVLLAAGVALSDCGEFEAAERIMRRVDELDPDSSIPAFNLGLVLQRGGQPEAAVEAFDEALRRQPGFDPATLEKARTLATLGRLDESSATYREYLGRKPADSHEWVSLGIVESDRERFDLAAEAYARAAAAEPDNASAYYNWAVTCSRAKDATGVQRNLDELTRIDPHDHRTSIVRMFRDEFEGDIEDAWREGQQALSTACQGEDFEAIDHVVSVVVRFGQRHKLDGEGPEFLLALHRAGLLNSIALRWWRELGGRRSSSAAQYRVVLHGEIIDDNMVAQLRERGAGDPPYHYFRPYEIFADNADDACAVAVELEEAMGDNEGLRVDSATAEPGQHEEWLGPAWIGPRHTYSIHDQDDDSDE